MRALRDVLILLASLVWSASLANGQAFDVKPFEATPNGRVQGNRRRWHRITIGFRGPQTSESNPVNPFTSYRMEVRFTHRETGKRFRVPGYYAADGNAANTGATSGNVWLCHFAPEEIGTWDWRVSFMFGQRAALKEEGGVSAGFFHNKRGSFFIDETDKLDGRDHRGKGILRYVGTHHLRFASGEWFLKGGADSPENFLAYNAFDNTPNWKGRRKSWGPHARDVKPRDPTWKGGRGRNIMGALNYLALKKGLNAFSFLTMNIGGDDRNVFPYISDRNQGDNYERIDVSKTAQWEVVFSHADKLGLFMHFKTQETENDQLLDGGALGNQRKLYYRELIARFGHHLALNWNMGEENTNRQRDREDFAAYIKKLDPYNHPIVIHTKPDQRSKERIFSGLLGIKNYNGISLQASQEDIFDDTLRWIRRSDAANTPWVVSNDEQAAAGVGIVPDHDPTDMNHDQARGRVLWANLLAGGAGCEYYFGFRFRESDLTLQDYRSRDQFFDQTRYALRFFRANKVPYWRMSNYYEPAFGTSMVLADKERSILVMYLADTQVRPRINLYGSNDSTFSVRWYNPRNGGGLQRGTVTRLGKGTRQNFGLPPLEQGERNKNKDWVILFRRTAGRPT